VGEYSHTLIPDRVDFVPEPQQVGAFLSSLSALGAAPLKPVITIAQATGLQTINNPFTGQTETRVTRKAKKLKDLAAVSGAIQNLDDYIVSIAGQGPPKLPAFKFDFKGNYEFFVHCSLRAEVVSTSDWHDDIPIKKKVEFFGKPCSPKDRTGIFHNPQTLEIIKVPKAGCARFWIEFEFGKWLFPSINDRLDLIEPKIVALAKKEFGVNFVQGCRWGA
jgi:hypothetical protein